jgi:hypothetical protein
LGAAPRQAVDFPSRVTMNQQRLFHQSDAVQHAVFKNELAHKRRIGILGRQGAPSYQHRRPSIEKRIGNFPPKKIQATTHCQAGDRILFSI